MERKVYHLHTHLWYSCADCSHRAAYIIVELSHAINAPGNPLAVIILIFIHQTNDLMQMTIFNIQIDMLLALYWPPAQGTIYFFPFPKHTTITRIAEVGLRVVFLGALSFRDSTEVYLCIEWFQDYL